MEYVIRIDGEIVGLLLVGCRGGGVCLLKWRGRWMVSGGIIGRREPSVEGAVLRVGCRCIMRFWNL